MNTNMNVNIKMNMNMNMNIMNMDINRKIMNMNINMTKNSMPKKKKRPLTNFVISSSSMQLLKLSVFQHCACCKIANWHAARNLYHKMAKINKKASS
jgi:hypothetical protein